MLEQGPAPAQARPPYLDFVPTGPGTLAGGYLRRFWQPVAVAASLPAGRATPIHLLGEDFTLYRGEPPLPPGEGDPQSGFRASRQRGNRRGEGGKPHLLGFRCAHRGTQLSTGWVEGDDLRCFYHGWKYDPTGQCIEQPAEPEPFCQKIRVRNYPTHEYLGLVFAYLGEGEPPPPPRYQLFEQEGTLSNGTERLACSYFNRMENSADPVHTKFVHRWPDFARYGLVGIPTIWAEEREWGLSTYIKWPDWPEDEVDIHHVLMPNILMNRIDRGHHIAWRVPEDDESSIVFNVALSPIGSPGRRSDRGQPSGFSPHAWGAAVLDGRAGVDEALQQEGVGSMERFNLQDYVAQVGQGAIADHEHERLGRTDAGIVLLRRIWARELRALAEGAPLTSWRAEETGLAEWGQGAEGPRPARARI